MDQAGVGGLGAGVKVGRHYENSGSFTVWHHYNNPSVALETQGWYFLLIDRQTKELTKMRAHHFSMVLLSTLFLVT